MRMYKKLISKIVTAKKLKSEFGFNIAYVSSMASIFHKENKLGRYFTNKKEKAIKRLPTYENISAKNDVFSELKSLFGEKNVKVREKSIEKSQNKR